MTLGPARHLKGPEQPDRAHGGRGERIRRDLQQRLLILAQRGAEELQIFLPSNSMSNIFLYSFIDHKIPTLFDNLSFHKIASSPLREYVRLHRTCQHLKVALEWRTKFMTAEIHLVTLVSGPWCFAWWWMNLKPKNHCFIYYFGHLLFTSILTHHSHMQSCILACVKKRKKYDIAQLDCEAESSEHDTTSFYSILGSMCGVWNTQNVREWISPPIQWIENQLQTQVGKIHGINIH